VLSEDIFMTDIITRIEDKEQYKKYVEKGIIEEARFHGDFFNINDKEEIEQALKGCKHFKADIETVFSNFDIPKYFNKTSTEELLAGMF
jgi:DNA-binding XRE family transcriptional regulator